MRSQTLDAIHGPVTVRRSSEGVPTARAGSWDDAFYALGWLHGKDRGGQIALMRTLGEGRLCELLRDAPGLFEADIYFRRLGLARDATVHEQEFTSPFVDAYCRGVSRAWDKHPPRALRLGGYRPGPLRPAHVLLLLKLTSFVGLAETQRVAELFVVEAVRRGVDKGRLEELFPAADGLDVELLRSLQIVPPFFPNLASLTGAPTGSGSNAWAVATSRAQNGAPILCCDPHLEVNRLPAVGYEVELVVGSAWVKGFTLPGLPGFLVGRTPEIAWGVTYTCADTSDFFVERCYDGRYLRDGEWLPFRQRREQILRKRDPAYDLTCYENDHGVLEGDPTTEGTYLCWGWIGFGSGGVGSIRGFTDLLRCRTVPEAQAAVRQVDIPTLHFVFADREGNIGYQFAGHVPRRREGWSGLCPVAGWDSANDWQGVLDPKQDMPSELNPECAYIATANEARQCDGRPTLTTVPLAPYRLERIGELLASQERVTLQDMQALQQDLTSREAERLLPFYREHVVPGQKKTLLEAWDFRYTPDSEAATLFENLHRAVMLEVLGGNGPRREWMAYVLEETNLYLVLAGLFADVLCRPDSVWLPAPQRQEVLRRGVQAGLGKRVEPWGKRQSVVFQNLFFGGRLPRRLGFDRGPHGLCGSHATVRAGMLVKAGGRTVAVAPAYHFVTDLADEVAWTNLPGGPSESRLSRWYVRDFNRWLRGGYKKI